VNITNADRTRRRRHASPTKVVATARRRGTRLAVAAAAMGALAAIILAFVIPGGGNPKKGAYSSHKARQAGLSTTPESYLGIYTHGVPTSYAGVAAFTRATGVRPRLVVYYSGWWEPFQTSFATTVAKHGAVPLVQVDPDDVSIGAIASGQSDAYLTSYARAVRAYHAPVILSFGHEMNGIWFSWGYRHTSPTVFVAAWRHIVTLFRAAGARNVTWLWTINVITARHGRIPSPAAWWPGDSYVTWVGMDGYYLKSSFQFVSVFGPTIAAVRELTSSPILIAEASAAPAAIQPTKIADLFAGVHRYGLLGFVWFNSVASRDYRMNSLAAIAAFRRGAETYGRTTW
jgi:mannan endo-1,4-beta-mannosidase